MKTLTTWVRHNRTVLIVLAIFLALYMMAASGMESSEWMITTVRSFSVGALIFLVASGFSIILGLMDVLNFAHGEMYMLGAFIGWTAYVRPDTIVDVLTPVLLIGGAFFLMPIWRILLQRLNLSDVLKRLWPVIVLLLGAALLVYGLAHYPIGRWSFDIPNDLPSSWSLRTDISYAGPFIPPVVASFEGISPLLGLGSLVLGSLFLSIAVSGFEARRPQPHLTSQKIPIQGLTAGILLMVLGLVLFAVNTPLSEWLYTLSTTLRFLISLVIATATGFILGSFIEAALIRPLYARPVYQLMITLGLAFITIELARAVWGYAEFQSPRPALFASTGEGCPAESLGGWLANSCSTITLLGGRMRSYNEVFIILMGLLVLGGVWLLLQRSRVGMIIRAGVQDREMVEALGINVRRVFNFVFALGVALAALGGALAGPALGLSISMGTTVLLSALIALAIGGLTSFPGAAAGSVLVALLQQFITKYGQLGINLPFLADPVKPSPPLVPASTVTLMVIILLVLPQGLFGRKE